MKALFVIASLLSMSFLAFAGPWYTYEEGVEGGDKVVNKIPSKERVYVFLRRSDSEKERDRNVPVKIIRNTEVKTVADIIEKVNGIYPKDYPKRAFLIIYREGASDSIFYTGLTKGDDGVYKGKTYKQKLDFKIKSRDVIYIGYSI